MGAHAAGTAKIIERNTVKYTKLQRADTDGLNHSLQSVLEKQGMMFNAVDPASFRARLGSYYARWKQEIGEKTWSLLEKHVGKLERDGAPSFTFLLQG